MRFHWVGKERGTKAGISNEDFSLSCKQNVEAQRVRSRIGKVVANWGYLNEMWKNIWAKDGQVRENTNGRARIAIGVAKQRDGKLSY